VVVRSLGGVFEWGGEYQGRWEVMVNTKDIRRAYSSVLGGLNWGVGTVLQGPSGTGKTETLKELARSMAKFCLVFNCSTLISTQLLQRLLAGLCYTGSWLCLDELNRLDI
jgi:dynein heavy chain